MRHCPVVNLCIPKYHKYSFYFDKPVYFNNEGRYFLLLLLEVIVLVLYNLAFYQYIGSEKLSERTVFLRIPWMIFQLVNQARWFTMCSYFVGSFVLLVKIFHLSVMFYAISHGNTLDELYNPHYYPYLFKEDEKNQGKWAYSSYTDKGFVKNWKLFFRQWKSNDYIVEIEDF